MPSIHAGDLDVYYTDNGTTGGLGTVVFVHGNWATCSWWELVQASPLLKPWRTVSYDVRGRGHDRTRLGLQHSVARCGSGFLHRGVGIEFPHLVGHSLGTAIVMQ